MTAWIARQARTDLASYLFFGAVVLGTFLV